MADLFEIDARDMTEMGRKLERSARVLLDEMKPTMMEVAEEIAALARVIARRNSTTIPGEIHAVWEGNTAVVHAGDEQHPLATLFERGNQKARWTSTTFRHPVFGNRDVWVTQDKHPFLRPARAANIRATNKAFEKACDRALNTAGLKIHWHGV